MMPFSDIHISQGSVATCLKRGGIFKHEFFCKFTTESASEKNFENRIIIGEVMGRTHENMLLEWSPRPRLRAF